MKKPIKNTYKAIITIILYLLYQTNFLISIIEGVVLRTTNGKISIFKLNKLLKFSIFSITDLIYIIILLFLFKDDIKNGINDLKNNFNKRVNLALKCWLIGCVLMMISSLILIIFLHEETSKNEALVRESIKLAPFYMLLTCSIIAPIFEEMVFRKSINIFIKNKTIFIIVSGLLFGLLHVIGNVSSPLDYLYIIPYGSMGCAFAYLLSKTNNITLPILLHMIHNTILVVSQFIRG